jgi:hypothetical protein
MSAQRKPISARNRIRKTAIWVTAWCWVIEIYVIAQVRGQTLAGAATIAAANALGGLIAWAIYHAISRRNDGLMIFIFAFLGTVPRSDQIALPLTDELTKRAVDLNILAIVSVAMGLLNRWLYRERRKGATARSPIRDAGA